VRLTWVVVGGVATLLFVAVVDAFRSSHDEASSPTARTGTTEERAGSALADCTRNQIAVSVDVSRFYWVVHRTNRDDRGAIPP
jgi:hypothetical protein